MSEFAVTAIGRDRPGIVAAVSGVLFELGVLFLDRVESLTDDIFRRRSYAADSKVSKDQSPEERSATGSRSKSPGSEVSAPERTG